jgi:hypothetical protein
MAQTQPTQPHAPSRPPLEKRQAFNYFALPFGCMFIVMSLIFMGIGWGFIIYDNCRMIICQPVSATIVSSQVNTLNYNGRSTYYKPEVKYSYSVNGKTYQCDRIEPGARTSSQYLSRAQDVVNRYPVQTQVTAWYWPSNPSNAFLVRKVVPFLYGWSLFVSLFFVAGVSVIVQSRRARRLCQPVARGNDGWVRIAASGSLATQLRYMIPFTVVWLLYSGIVMGDYFLLAQTMDVGGIVISLIVLFVDICLVLGAIRCWRLWHDFMDAELWISSETISPGDTILFKVRQEVRRDLEIEQMSVGLVCVRDDRYPGPRGGTSYVANEAWSRWNDLQVERFYQAGHALGVQGHVSVPADAQPTTGFFGGAFPSYRWYFALSVTAPGEPALYVYFPAIVNPAQ